MIGMRPSFPTPSLSWGRPLLPFRSHMLSRHIRTAKQPLRSYLKREMVEGNIPGSPFLKKRANYIILNNRDNMILTEMAINSFFEKLASFFSSKPKSSVKTYVPKLTAPGGTAEQRPVRNKLTTVPDPQIPYTQYKDVGGIGKTLIQSPVPTQPVPLMRPV